MKSLYLIVFVTIAGIGLCQNYDPNSPPNTYRSSENPYYWQNNLPFPSYWQQDVHYKINATIDDSLDIIDCDNLELTYWNNSPDTLYYVYFHLYQNAFTPQSYLTNNYKNNGKNVSFGRYEKQGLGTVIESLLVNGQKVDTILDNTILKVFLPEPLAPNTAVLFNMKFKSYFDTGSLRRRMKIFSHDGVKHYDGVHWYPSIAVYDSKFGWTTEQHLDKEFYSNFGTFDVKLTFPNNYVLDATGTLQNEEEVLPKELMAKLDIRNFSKKADSISTPILRNTLTPKTWHFYAENVHNFAFTADPTYRIGELDWEGIKVVTLAQEQNAWGWQKSGEFAKNVIKTYSTDFGHYAWPKIIIADARDGMEYSMLTLDGGIYNTRQQYLLAHEIGHMWFYGMVGSNETYRAMMDEGFTQFLTVWSMDAITGPTFDYKSLDATGMKKYKLNHLPPRNNRYERLYYPYLKQVHQSYDHQLNTHSSQFNGAVRHGGGYGLVYYKTGVMLYNLKYVLGDELFLKAMRYYFNKWKMKHPYPEDFRQAIIEFTKVDLNWFFDQWIETTKYIDYGIKKVKRTNKTQYQITFERKAGMHMPLDFVAITKSGDTLNYHIPNTWFIKNTDATVLPKWYGFDNVKPTYSVTINVNSNIENIVIDPDHVLADIDLRDNQWKQKKKIGFDHRVRNYASWKPSQLYIRPDIWYNHFDGLQIGGAFRTDYFKEESFYDGAVWVNTGVLQGKAITDDISNDFQPVAFEFNGKQNLRKYWDHFYLFERIQYNAGLAHGRFGLEKTFKKADQYKPEYTNIKLYGNFLYRKPGSGFIYQVHPELWNHEIEDPSIPEDERTIQQQYASTNWNNSINIDVERKYTYERGFGLLRWESRAQGLNFDAGYAYSRLTAINLKQLGKLQLRTRLFAQLGSFNIPVESSLYLNGANAEELAYNKFTRAAGFFPADYQHLHMSGGLNIRGSYYSLNNANGLSGVSSSVELDFDQLFGLKIKGLKFLHLDTYLFGDIGSIAKQQTSSGTISQVFDPFVFDAGLGTVLTVSFPGYDIAPFKLRIDVPMIENRSEDLFRFNFVAGVERSF